MGLDHTPHTTHHCVTMSVTRDGRFGGPTWNKKANAWNKCFRYDTPANRFLIAPEDCVGVGKEAVAAAKQVEAKLISYANAVCRVRLAIAENAIMSGFFFTPRRAVTGIRFDYKSLHKADIVDSVVHLSFSDQADGLYSFGVHARAYV